MIPKTPTTDAKPTVHRILVVDDDRRVRELLEVALTAHGFAVITASDGEEAVKRAIAERPDLVVLDVRLPKRSGLEVCDTLRGDPEDPSIPIILVSAAAEVDARLQAFSRGADDYLSKPFSPKELIARIRRMLSRSAEARLALRRARDLERDLARAQDEAKRARSESGRAERLRELAFGWGRELLRTADGDALARRLLVMARAKLGVSMAALLMRERPGGPLVPAAILGDVFERIANLEIPLESELAAILAGLGRPVLRAELERIPGIERECALHVPGVFTLLAPIRGAEGLDGLLLFDERTDGAGIERADADLLAGLCEIAAVSLGNGLQFRNQSDLLLEMAARSVPPPLDAAARAEAASLVTRAARAALLAPRWRDLVVHGVAFGAWALTPEGRPSLERVSALDPTGRAVDLLRLIERAFESGSTLPPVEERDRAAWLLRAACAFEEARARGLATEEALAESCERCKAEMDEGLREALVTAARDARWIEGHAA
jgi:DNA-binding response OmpR family regulator